MLTFPFYLNSMDPGDTTGLGLLRIEEEDFTVEATASIPYNPECGSNPVNTIIDWYTKYDDIPHVFLYEDFHVRPGKKSVDTTALKVIGGFQTWCYNLSNPPARYLQVVKQEPVEAKNLVTDPVLERLGLKMIGHEQRHINDTFRHAVTFLSRARYRPVCERGFPRSRPVPSR